jgi:hypothetical protein
VCKLVTFQTLLLVRNFEEAFDMVERYIDTANMRGEELSWKNYRGKYLSHARRARALFRRILRECRSVGSIQPVAKNMSTPLAVIWDIETETKDKLDAAATFRHQWKDFSEILHEEVRRPYDFFPNREFEHDEKLCFVIMPFEKKMTKVYKEGIKAATKEIGLKCKLAKDISRSTPIIQDVWELINRARVVVADLTGKNPNVFYELGMAHSLGKRSILITQNPKDVPFDVKYIRYIEYRDSLSGRRKLKGSLKTMLRSILKE